MPLVPLEVSNPLEGIESMANSSVFTHILRLIFLLAKDLLIQLDKLKNITIVNPSSFCVFTFFVCFCNCSKLPSDFNPINPS